MNIIEKYIDYDSSSIIRDYLVGDKKYWKSKNIPNLNDISRLSTNYFNYMSKDIFRDLFKSVGGYNITSTSFFTSKKRNGQILATVKQDKVLFYGDKKKEIEYHTWS